GVQFACEPGDPRSLVITPDGPVSRFVPFSWSDDDKAEVVSTRAAVSMRLAGEQPVWAVIYTPTVTATLRVEDGTGTVLFDGIPPSHPDRAASVLEGRCRIWRIGQPGDDATANLDDGDVEALQALGYID
ncbi:MAG: hypothetical protein VX265_04060, partial [Myxococcota bacterium]|nr:hypothetical protein [Myxococcota bacterium]